MDEPDDPHSDKTYQPRAGFDDEIRETEMAAGQWLRRDSTVPVTRLPEGR